MDNLEYQLPLVFTLGVVVLIVSLYQWSSWSWKTRPWIPFALGVLMLLGACLLDWGVESRIAITNANANATALNTTSQQRSSQLLTAMVKVGERQLKLLELIAIPLAVSLIAAAVLLRVDREFNLQVSEYSKARRDLKIANDAAKTAVANLETALTDSLLGKELLELHNEAVCRQKVALRQFIDMNERFSILVNSGAVNGPNDDT